jgi:alpha-N-arabinofuranosidase
MHGSRQCFAISVLIAILSGVSFAQPVPVTIDATRTGQPITKLMFGGFMEPATTQVWAEMLADRKFFNEINSKPLPASATGGFGRRGPQRRWMPVGGDEFVAMDPKSAYVGEWSPLIRLDAATPHGISQTGLALRAGRAYTGRVVISGTPAGNSCCYLLCFDLEMAPKVDVEPE